MADYKEMGRAVEVEALRQQVKELRECLEGLWKNCIPSEQNVVGRLWLHHAEILLHGMNIKDASTATGEEK